MIRIVVFDLGGVLVRVAGTWEEAHAGAGLGPTRFPAGPKFRAALHRMVAAYDLGEIELDEVARALAAASEGAYSEADVRALHAAISQEEMDGVPALFDTLEAAGLETGVLSNTNRSHWRRLANEAGGTPEYPSVVRARHRHASFLLRLAKPDPRIYRAFEERTAFAPAEILFFDDREENVVGARDAGWSAERVDPNRPTVPQMREHLRARRLG